MPWRSWRSVSVGVFLLAPALAKNACHAGIGSGDCIVTNQSFI